MDDELEIFSPTTSTLFLFALNLFPLYDLFFLVALSLDALLISLVLS